MIANQICKKYDPKLLDFCATENQLNIYAAYGVNGTINATARALGKDASSVSQAIVRIQKRAEAGGLSESFDARRLVPSGEKVIGRSIYTKDDDGNNIWLKTKASVEKQQEAFKTYIDALSSDIKPAKKIPTPKGSVDSDLMNVICIGDAHIGMYAFAPETMHSDFDVDIASSGLRTALDDLIDRSPPSEIGMLVDVGDFMHANSSHGKTFAGTDLDMDSRYSRVLEIAGEVMQYAVTQMLKKFKKVVVVVAKGNHNPDAAVAVQQITKAYFHKNTRVEVLKTSGFFHYVEWKGHLIGINHGDKIKAAKLVNVMARDMPEAWGRCTHRIWITGHYHHEQVLELDGCTVYKMGALPPPDSWHAGAGFGGDGKMQMMTLKEGGRTHSNMVYDLPRPIIEPDIKL